MAEMGIVRPTGVTILAILNFLGGLLGILGFTYYTFLSIIGLLISLVQLVVGWGLWNLQEWSHPYALLLAVVAIFIAPLNIFVTAAVVDIEVGFLVPGLFFGWIIQGIIIYYLTRPEIKDVFGITGLWLGPLQLQ